MTIFFQENRTRESRTRSLLQGNSFLRNLNRSTLILSFPHISPRHIDAALSLCENDLSEAISFLQLRVRIQRGQNRLPTLQSVPQCPPLYMQGVNAPQKNATPAPPLHVVPNVPPPRIIASAGTNTVTYIPTKYTDVEIVEISNRESQIPNDNVKIMEVDNDVLRMLQTCDTAAVPHKVAASQHGTGNQVITSEDQSISSSSVSKFSPATVSSSSSSDYEKLKVYDFAEDEPVLYHLPKPVRKPLSKVGIILKKEKSGHSVSLL